MKPLKIGITGVRGVAGEAFTPELIVGFAQAFGTYLDGGRILEVVGRPQAQPLDVAEFPLLKPLLPRLQHQNGKHLL